MCGFVFALGWKRNIRALILDPPGGSPSARIEIGQRGVLHLKQCVDSREMYTSLQMLQRDMTDPMSIAASTRRHIWVDLLLYPAHTIPIAAAPVMVGVALTARDGVSAPMAAVLAFLGSWLIHLEYSALLAVGIVAG
jgi:hypothetical protein